MDNKKAKYEVENTIGLEKFQDFFSSIPRNYWACVFNIYIRITFFTTIIIMYYKLNAISFLYINVAMIIFSMIYIKLKMNELAKKSCNIKENEEIKYVLRFYDEYFEQENERGIARVKYSDIVQTIETDIFFYFKVGNKFYLFEKTAENVELCNFFRELNKEKYTSQIGKSKKKNNHRNNIKDGMLLLFILTLLSVIITFSISWLNKSLNIADTEKIKDEVIFFSWLPVTILSVIMGFKHKYMKNIFFGIVVTAIIGMGGFVSMLPKWEISYEKLCEYEEVAKTEIPSTGIYIENDSYNYPSKNMKKISHNFIWYRGGERGLAKFERNVENSDYWILGEELDSQLRIFTIDKQQILVDYYYLIYNADTNEYNSVPEESGTYHIYLMTYSNIYMNLELIDYTLEYIK